MFDALIIATADLPARQWIVEEACAHLVQIEQGQANRGAIEQFQSHTADALENLADIDDHWVAYAALNQLRSLFIEMKGQALSFEDWQTISEALGELSEAADSKPCASPS